MTWDKKAGKKRSLWVFELFEEVSADLLQLMLQATLSASREGVHTASGMAAYLLLVTSAPKPRAILLKNNELC